MKFNIDNIEWLSIQEPLGFEEAINFMENRVAEIIENSKNQLIWIIEHKPLYTAGVSAKSEDLICKTNIPIYKTNRGGKYTYHGPGMKIIYVMIDLKKFFTSSKPDIALFVEFLENWVIEILKHFNIDGKIKKGRVGIWVEGNNTEEKIAAIGIKLKKWVTYHGIAININPSLEAFNNIVPCGIREFGVTSLEKLGKKIISNEEFFDLVKKSFYTISTNS